MAHEIGDSESWFLTRTPIWCPPYKHESPLSSSLNGCEDTSGSDRDRNLGAPGEIQEFINVERELGIAELPRRDKKDASTGVHQRLAAKIRAGPNLGWLVLITKGVPPGRRAVPRDTFSRMPHPKFPNLTVLDHPLIQHKLAILRDKHTTTRDFKQLVNEIAMLMAYEVTKDLPLETAEVETPLERMQGVRVAGKKLALVPILRAGLGMVEGIAQLIPSARVGHIGIYREHDTLEPVDYYFKIPSGEDARDFFVLDPMLATGGSAVDAVGALKHAGAQRIRFLCLVAAPEGVRRLLEAHPDVPVFAAALDRELNEHGYILPGLGDAGDRLFGTR